MQPADLAALLKLLRDSGVRHYKTPELELQLGPEPLPPEPDAHLSGADRDEYEEALSLAHVQPLPEKFRS